MIERLTGWIVTLSLIVAAETIEGTAMQAL
jgi:hypothetical protein